MPYRIRSCCLSFLLLVLSALPVCGQVPASKQIGVEMGLHINLLEDALVSPYRYKGSQLQFAAIRYKVRKEKSSIEISVDRSSLEMQREDFGDNLSPERLSNSNYGILLAWHRQLSLQDARLRWSLGLRNQIQGSVTNISIPTFGGVLSNSDSYQLAIGNLALSTQGQYALNTRHLLLVEAAYTLLYYGSRQESLTIEDDFFELPFFLSLPGDYQQLTMSLSDEISLSKHWTLCPAYRLSYINYRIPVKLKQLHQSYAIGLYYLL